MPGIGNNLYPPITATYMPAFVRTTACKIYFSLSIYNSIEEIKNVQIVINNQNTNLSALDSKQYPAGIKITNLQIDENEEGDNKYFVVINPSDLQGGIFELNQFYKVQLRFTGVGATDLLDKNKITSWLIDNQSFFSEWSTVCLVKGIQKPEIYLREFENIKLGDFTIFSTEMVRFTGKMYFTENEDIEKECLKSYRIQIQRNYLNGGIAYDSGDIYTNIYNPNEINHTLNVALEDGVNYIFTLYYTTTNGYTSLVYYKFTIIQNAADVLEAKITAISEEDYGRIKVNILSTITEIFFGNLTIRRTSSESNFKVWEDVHEVTIENREALNYTWYDYTVESGIWYKYCAQRRDSSGARGVSIITRNPVMSVFDDMFLTRENIQIKLKYDPSISSFKKTFLESKTDTLGSKYPIIRRNGNVGYRQFPISGLITAFCDEDGIFLNKENIYNDSESYYESYNTMNNIDKYKDFIYERKFREKIMDFLHEDDIKLFRSTTEGNILIRLMDISFTPNQTLGRMLYNFNATAYEIDECSLSNYEKYGIQSIGKFKSIVQLEFFEIGQVRGEYSNTQQDIFKILEDKYAKKATNKYINEVEYLDWVRIEFNSSPYLIKTVSNGSIIPLPANEKPNENVVLGYIVYINNQPIVVSQKGYYELIGNDVKITSIYFPIYSDVSIDYKIKIKQKENQTIPLYRQMQFETKAGQIRDYFKLNENIFLRIYQKYLINRKGYQQRLLSLDKISIEAVPGTIAYIKDSFDEDYFKHEIGPTGILDFYDSEAVINGIFFDGIQLYETDIDTPREGEFKYIGEVQSLEEINNPDKNYVYSIEDSRYIYYNGEWFKFSDDNVVQCPVYASIDYIYELTKGEY